MRKLLFATAATVALAVAAPASAQVYSDWDGGVGVHVGPFGFGLGPRYGWDDGWRGRYAYGYAYGCHLVRERIVTPYGNVVFRTHRVCD
jgi:hypothetical protein